MSQNTHDDTDKIPAHSVCLEHSGIKADIRNTKTNIEELWKAMAQIRMMFAGTMLATVGSLLLLIWNILRDRVGL